MATPITRADVERAVEAMRRAATNPDPVAVANAVAAMNDYQRRLRGDPRDEALHYLHHTFQDRLRLGDNAQHVLCAVTITELHDRPYAEIELVFQHGWHERIFMPLDQVRQLTSNMIAAIYQEARASYLADYQAAEQARRMRDAELFALMQRPDPPNLRYERGVFEWAENQVCFITGAQESPEAMAALAREQEAKLAAANERASEYLKSVTTPEQFAEWEEHGYFHVRGGDTGKPYRINKPVGGYNIDELDEAGNKISRICFVPVAPTHAKREPGLLHLYPLCDVVAIQKLALQLDETATLHPSVCNRLPPLSEGPNGGGGGWLFTGGAAGPNGGGGGAGAAGHNGNGGGGGGAVYSAGRGGEYSEICTHRLRGFADNIS